MQARRLVPSLGALLALLVCAPVAEAQIPEGLKSACTLQTAAPGNSYRFCDDGLPPPGIGGREPNIGGVNAVRVPAKYDGWEGLPAKAADAASVVGADPDGNVALDVDVTLPTSPAPAGGYPLIAMMHGCCAGTKRDWEDTSLDPPGEHWHFNNAWFASRGYVVLNYTARGFKGFGSDRGSTGETQLDSRRYEINDFQYLAGLIADDSFFNVNPQKVVATGGSYGGGFAWLALTDPLWRSPGGRDMKLAAAAPRYGWTDLVYSLIPNGTHSLDPDQLPAVDGSDSVNPFGIPKRSIAFALFITGQFGSTFPSAISVAFQCLNSFDPFETNPLCAQPIAETLPEFISDRSAYYQNEFFARIASDARYRIPIFNAATFSDPLFTAVENLRMSNRLQRIVPSYPIQQYFGDYEHFVQNKPKEWGDICGDDRHVCRFADYPGGNLNADPAGLRRTGVHTRLNRFIDHYAQPASNPSAARPEFDVTASLMVCAQNASATQPADEPGPTFVASRFELLAPNTLELRLPGTRTTKNPSTANPHADQTNPLNNSGGPARCFSHTNPAGPDVATYDSAPLERTATMIGGTRVTIDYAATSAQLQLNSRLYDVFPDGTAVMVDRGPRRVTSASGSVTYQLHGNGWRFEPGHRIRIEIAQDDDPFVKESTVPSTATLTGVTLRVPVREAQPPRLEDFKNVAHYCKAVRAFLGLEEFRRQWGANKKGRNAFGKCVSSGGQR